MSEPILISTGSRQLIRATQAGQFANLVDFVIPDVPAPPPTSMPSLDAVRLDADRRLPLKGFCDDRGWGPGTSVTFEWQSTEAFSLGGSVVGSGPLTAVVTVDAKGRVRLPKAAPTALGVGAGDTLVVVESAPGGPLLVVTPSFVHRMMFGEAAA